jgi:hypothetical protein
MTTEDMQFAASTELAISHEQTAWTEPSTERRILDLEDDVLGILDGRNWPLFDFDLQGALEDDCFHGGLGHVLQIERIYGKNM